MEVTVKCDAWNKGKLVGQLRMVIAASGDACSSAGADGQQASRVQQVSVGQRTLAAARR